MRIDTDLFLRVVCGGEKTSGGVELTPDALDAILEIAGKIENPKRDKTKISENLNKYISKAAEILLEEQKKVDAGGKVMTREQFAEALELKGESTVRMNKDLNRLFVNFKKMNSAKAPATVNNDYDTEDDEF